MHMVHDLGAAADLYRRIGFNVGPLLGGEAFVEQTICFANGLLALIGPPKQSTREPRTILWQGLSGVILSDVDAAASSDVKSSPHLTGAIAPGSELGAIGFSYGGQPHPVTDLALPRHSNSVSNIAGLVIVAKNPSDHHIFLSDLTGQRELRATSAGVTAQTGSGEIGIVDPVAFRGLFGIEPPDVSTVARLAAARFDVRDSAALVATLDAAGVPFIRHMGHVVIGPASAMGASLVFETADG
jgi:hypothetical protein